MKAPVNMDDYVTVALIGDIPAGEGRAFLLGSRRIAVFLAEGRYYALDNACPHMGDSLALGDVEEDKVVCPRHRWAYRLGDGMCEESDRWQARTYPVRICGSEIQVLVVDDDTKVS